MFANCKCFVCGGTISLSEPIYCYDTEDGEEQTFHMLCFKEQTRQGIQGFAPTKIYPPLKGNSQCNTVPPVRS